MLYLFLACGVDLGVELTVAVARAVHSKVLDDVAHAGEDGGTLLPDCGFLVRSLHVLTVDDGELVAVEAVFDADGVELRGDVR